MKLIADRINQIASILPQLVVRLRDNGYVFADSIEVLPGVKPDVNDDIRRIENEIGTLPCALAEFWRTIGSANFCGHHPDWHGCQYPDPLVIYPVSQAIVELDEFLADREERMRCNFPFVIPISTDDHHKQNGKCLF